MKRRILLLGVASISLVSCCSFFKVLSTKRGVVPSELLPGYLRRSAFDVDERIIDTSLVKPQTSKNLFYRKMHPAWKYTHQSGFHRSLESLRCISAQVNHQFEL